VGGWSRKREHRPIPEVNTTMTIVDFGRAGCSCACITHERTRLLTEMGPTRTSKERPVTSMSSGKTCIGKTCTGERGEAHEEACREEKGETVPASDSE